MFEIPSLNENNEKILCEMNGKNADMGMNIKVKFLKAGESISLDDKNNETAVLLVSGSVKFKWNSKE
ncbi:MAG: 5-deoxy-glucuronate isomerase, partial [Clostridiales bacterium]|nr:5-deoxy-glucuronate isomerase [Clostridiales bacterium]